MTRPKILNGLRHEIKEGAKHPYRILDSHTNIRVFPQEFIARIQNLQNPVIGVEEMKRILVCRLSRYHSVLSTTVGCRALRFQGCGFSSTVFSLSWPWRIPSALPDDLQG